LSVLCSQYVIKILSYILQTSYSFDYAIEWYWDFGVGQLTDT